MPSAGSRLVTSFESSEPTRIPTFEAFRLRVQ